MRAQQKSFKRNRSRHFFGKKRLRIEQLESRRLLAGVADPGFPYVDANDDGLFNVADLDVLLDSGELNDGFFDTTVPEGPNYTVPRPDASLRIYGTPIIAAQMNYSAEKTVGIYVDLRTISGDLVANGNSVGIDADLTSARDLAVTAGLGAIAIDPVESQTLQATRALVINTIDVQLVRRTVLSLLDLLEPGLDAESKQQRADVLRQPPARRAVVDGHSLTSTRLPHPQ